MSNELFSGLDSFVLGDQPATIDINDFNPKEAEDKIDPKDATKDGDKTPEDKSKPKDKSTDKKEDFIDIEDWNKQVKSKDEESEDKTNLKDKTPEAKVPTKETQEDKIKGWASYFKEEEILPDLDLEKFDGTPESLKEAFKNEGLNMVESYKEQLPPLIKYLADNWEEGVPLDELVNIKSNQIRYSSIDPTKLEGDDAVSLRKDVMTQYLKETTSLPDSKITKLVQQKIDLGEDLEEAKENLTELNKIELAKEDTLKKETKRQKELRVAENAKVIREYEKAVKATKEIIPGLKISEKEQADILNKITNPIGVDGYGNPVSYVQNIMNEDPIKFNTALNYILTLTKGFTDWSKINTTATTQATKSLASLLENPTPKGTKDNISTTKKSSLMELLEYNAKTK